MQKDRWAFKVPLEPLGHPEPGRDGYEGFNPRSEILSKGWTDGVGGAPLLCDILIEHDVAIAVRDGCKLYADILRPPQSTRPVPALICWSPFGKKFNGDRSLDLMTPYRLGIPKGVLSGLEKFEAPDPNDAVSRGYAIINIDSRGAFDSEGTMAVMGTQEAEDGFDVIEHIAGLPWCSGKVALCGNSHLAIIQWFIAALRPPHLTCIAPWEGCGDLYREQFARGGIYSGDLFDKLIVKYMLKGRHSIESFRKMFEEHPLANAWWNDKRPDMHLINISTYITGTYSNTMHGMGAIRGFLEVDCPDKWLRFHGTQEWYDLWGNERSRNELFQFFDHYLKGIDNRWQDVPKVRVAALRFGEEDPIENIVVKDFPIPNTRYEQAYLKSDGKLDLERAPESRATLEYDSCGPKGSMATFTYTFEKQSKIIGIPKAVLYMSCPDHDDLDVFVILKKMSASGEPMTALNVPWKGIPVGTIAEIPPDKATEVITYNGPTGVLRASQRSIDKDKSMHENWPYYPQDREEKVPPGETVRLEIGIWATGIQFEAGEGIQLQVAGHFLGIANFGAPVGSSKGKHVVHCGGNEASHVVLPFVDI